MSSYAFILFIFFYKRYRTAFKAYRRIFVYARDLPNDNADVHFYDNIKRFTKLCFRVALTILSAKCG